MVPEHLAHKPIVSVDNYEKIDGPYSRVHDISSLSLGFAQWDQDDIALKIFRQHNSRWSRQSEELPPHRVLDLGILLIAAMLKWKDGDFITRYFNIDIHSEDQMENSLFAFFENNKVLLEERLMELSLLVDRYFKR